MAEGPEGVGGMADDPGWRPGPRALLAVLVPGMALRSLRGDGLAVLRQLWTTFVAAMLLFGVVTVLIVPGSVTSPVGPWLVGVALLLVATLASERVVLPPLEGADDHAVGAAYRTRFFLRVALAESVQLLALVAAFVTGQAWVYFLVFPVTLRRFWWFAPTSSRLRAEQEELARRGSPVSLVAAIRTTPVGGAPGR